MNMSVAQLGGGQSQPPPSLPPNPQQVTPAQHGQHQHHSTRAPRTPESYFNVPESIALLNIVKSERIQSAFQSNRKNHASVWEMVADVLNRMSSRKRSAKQCCNRYENLKKIYTQLKKNPEKHVRRNWPYMYLFKEIEENRGECWGSNGKRSLNGASIGLNGKGNSNELSYYHRRHAAALSMLINPAMHKDTMALAAMAMNNGENLERFVANNFVETEMNEDSFNENDPDDRVDLDDDDSVDEKMNQSNGINNGERHANSPTSYDKGGFAVNNYMKYEPSDDHEFSDINLMPVNYNNPSNYPFPSNVDPNILQPDVIVDTDNASQSSNESRRSKRKASSSSDTESTNFELIQYLKRREKRDEYMMKRMEEREERLLKLLERTVMAFEMIAAKPVTTTFKNGINGTTSSPAPVSPSQSPNHNTKNSFKSNNN